MAGTNEQPQRRGRAGRPAGARSVSIYLDDDNRAFLDLAAADRDRSRSYLINLIVREYRRQIAQGDAGPVRGAAGAGSEG